MFCNNNLSLFFSSPTDYDSNTICNLLVEALHLIASLKNFITGSLYKVFFFMTLHGFILVQLVGLKGK